MIKRLQKHGNSMALIIENPVMQALGITEETPLERGGCVTPPTRHHRGR